MQVGDYTLGAGKHVGDYTLGGLLGKGGMSEVYAASHPALGNRLALKLLRDDADGAFHVEARIRDVSHPNLVRILDAGQEGERAFIVMERIDGGDLARHFVQHPPDEATARVLFAQIADGMATVHAAGIVHRDLKPQNVMLEGDVPRIVDFGIAKVLGENAALVTSRRIGTLGYMAPEQLVGGMIAPSVDVWAIGVMLFEAVTGKLPFDGFTESYTPQLVETAPRVASLARVSREYDALVARCLDGDPARRPTMAWIAQALRDEVAVEVVDERVTQDVGPIGSPLATTPNRSRSPSFTASMSPSSMSPSPSAMSPSMSPSSMSPSPPAMSPSMSPSSMSPSSMSSSSSTWNASRDVPTPPTRQHGPIRSRRVVPFVVGGAAIVIAILVFALRGTDTPAVAATPTAEPTTVEPTTGVPDTAAPTTVEPPRVGVTERNATTKVAPSTEPPTKKSPTKKAPTKKAAKKKLVKKSSTPKKNPARRETLD